MADFDINVTGTIADDSVTNAKLANVPQATIKGSPVAAGTVNPIDLTPDQASTILDTAADAFVRTSMLSGYLQDGDTLSSGLTFPNAGLKVLDTAANNTLAIGSAENLSANRSLNFHLNDSDRILSIGANTTLNGGTHSGTNTGDNASDPVGSAAAAQAAAATDATTKANAAQAFAIQRANHTGTQLASTISDFNAAALAAAPAETTTTIGSLINGATSKTTPVDADMVGLMDSAASNVLKKLSWANIKATLKTYFDTLYQTIITFGTGVQTALGVNVGTAGAFVVNGGALGTPSSGSASNLTGTTAAAGTSNTNLATNAFVQQELALQNPSFLTYSGGSQATTSTTYADVHSSAAFTISSTGVYEVAVNIVHDAAATTTGAGFSWNGPTSNFQNTVVDYSVLSTDKSSVAVQGYDWGVFSTSSLTTGSNYASIRTFIRFTATGTLALRFKTEVGGSAITITAVTGFIRRVSP